MLWQLKHTSVLNVSKRQIYEAKEHAPCNRSTPTPDEFKVPNIVHYIWYINKSFEMRFDQVIGVLSAKKYIQPDVIYFHTNNAPHGRYFEELKNLSEFKVW